MKNWKNASESDSNLFTVIAKLFRNNPQLLNFFFHPEEPRLGLPCKKIKQLAKSFCTADELLVRITLDIWDGSGTINFNEIYQKLDENNYGLVLTTLENLRGNKCIKTLCQLKTDIFFKTSAN